ncbi:hypothetical protein FJT64_009972 [Amphibalanus amphitrite]|uniref:Reverse transcriptase domain-containing protein n=1 Tax=Amphibalanus amphitrite TaxID=1232801 RepID=A0A6A4VDH2_AMPAM|nr:hypothetical protein FJT64_009972 [Amphibalanus amphitrite]
MWDQKEVGPGLRLIETVFGHVLHGQAQNQQTGQRRVYRCQLADVERMWSLDAVGISAKETADEVPPEPTWNPEEQRYEMGLLWKSDDRPASNLASTELRTRRLVSKMSTADIRATFHQIVLKEEDRRYVQFLWGDRHLRFQRVPFGVSCSPYMLLRTVCCHVRQCLVSYMDDLCPTFGTREEAAAGMKEVSSVFSKARMELHKTRTTGDVSSEDSKVLGLAWNTETDRLAVTVPEMLCPRTRSELLSAVAKSFDPLGLLTPWLVRGKALFQRTWSVELTWDEPLPDALQAEVAAWWQDSAGSTLIHQTGSSTLECTPDTGAEATVMGDAVARSLGIALSRLQTDHRAKFTAVGRRPLDCLGAFSATLRLGDRFVDVTVCVISGLTGTLISWFDSVALGILPANFPAQIPDLGACKRLCRRQLTVRAERHGWRG